MPASLGGADTQWSSTWPPWSSSNLDTFTPTRVTVNGQTHPPPRTACNHFGSSQPSPPLMAMQLDTVPFQNLWKDVQHTRCSTNEPWALVQRSSQKSGDPWHAAQHSQRSAFRSWPPVQQSSWKTGDLWDAAQQPSEPAFDDPWASAPRHPAKVTSAPGIPVVMNSPVRDGKYKH